MRTYELLPGYSEPVRVPYKLQGMRNVGYAYWHPHCPIHHREYKPALACEIKRVSPPK